jgi:hypothetical protein
VVFALRQPIYWQREWLLLLGLTVTLILPGFTVYGRFRMAGALPILALISAGTATFILRRWRTIFRAAYVIAAIIGSIPATVGLPLFYHTLSYPLNLQLDEIRPIADWVTEQTGAPAGTRILIQPEIEETANFYVLSGYLPATIWVPNYEWAFVNEHERLMDKLLAGVAADPPEYVVLVDSSHYPVLPPLWAYIEANYRLTDETQLDNIGRVFLYEYRP